MLKQQTAEAGSQLLERKTKVTLKYNQRLISANTFSVTGTNLITM